MNKNKKEIIDDLNYIKKAMMKGTLYQYDAIIFIIDTLIRYLKKDELHGGDSGEAV